MKKSGTADLPLHYGKVPPWLSERMTKLGGAITDAIVLDYGTEGFIARISDPFWFQAMGSVMGMDWHSSGITTSVIGALRRALQPKAGELGLFICGGRGAHSRNTPAELMRLGEKTGWDADKLVRSSRLTAKVDNNAVQDGYQIYLHSFIVDLKGNWAVVQQGMNDGNGMARRYHWHSVQLSSFVESPHTAIVGKNAGEILNLTDKNASPARDQILEFVKLDPGKALSEARKLVLPSHHYVSPKVVDLKRLGSVLAMAYHHPPEGFEDVLLVEGLGPRTLQSMALVAEVIHGKPVRFSDPARFSFAHGGKDGHPFPVPLKVYDEVIQQLTRAVEKSKLGQQDKKEAFKKLHEQSLRVEKDFEPEGNLEEYIEKERRDSWKYGGMTVKGPAEKKDSGQLKLF